MEQQNKYALITGATSGIGLELAKLFAKDGYNLVIVSRDQSNLEKTAYLLKQENESIDVVTISKDLFKPESASEVYQEVKDKGIKIDVLVNDAGQGLYGEFVDTDIEREIDIIHLNIISLVVLTKHFLKDMIARGSGKVLNLSSIASKVPGPYQSIYHATKAFVQSFTEAIHSEVKDKGIIVTALLPGVTDTDFFNKAGMLQSKALKGDKADPADVAKDGYDALMNDDDKVVSGFKNKLQTAIGNLMPDSMIADQVKKQQEPAE